MRTVRSSLAAALPLAALTFVPSYTARGQSPAEATETGPLDAAMLKEIGATLCTLIDAENRHDIDAVRPIVWDSPSALFVAKTATPAEGNWAGFWGKDVVVRHLGELYQGTFVMDPDYTRLKVVGITRDVAETYVPLNISVAYAGQTGTPKPFLMIVNWVRTLAGWKMATDIALPIPVAQPR